MAAVRASVWVSMFSRLVKTVVTSRFASVAAETAVARTKIEYRLNILKNDGRLFQVFDITMLAAPVEYKKFKGEVPKLFIQTNTTQEQLMIRYTGLVYLRR